MLVKSVLALLALFFVQFAEAQSYQLGTPIVSGPGCPSDTASVNATPDGSAISILFDQFSIRRNAGEFSGRNTCNIRIPITVQPGYFVATSSIHYRGFKNIPLGVVGRIHTHGPVTGRRGPKFLAQTALASGMEDFSIVQTVRQQLPSDRTCEINDEIVFTTDLHLTAGNEARAPRPFPAEAELILDSADAGASEITLGMRIRPCRGQGRGNGNGRFRH